MLTILSTEQDLSGSYIVCVIAIGECLIGDSCVISAFSCVCAISAMDDGNSSPERHLTVCVVQESLW